MKKVLFGSTALLAAAAFAAPASAQEIELSIGGKQEMFFGVGDVDDNPGETWGNTGMATDTELYFTGQTTLDNGITVQAIIQLEAEDNNDRNADEQAIILSGGFGALQIGQRQGYVGQLQYTTPDVGVFDWDEYDDSWAEIDFVDGYYTDDDLSVSYVTPSFFGFSLAGTYAPDSSDNDDSQFEDWNNTGSDYKDMFAVGGAYDNEFSGVGIHLDASYNYQFGTYSSTTTQTANLVTGAVTSTTTNTDTPDRALIRGGAAVSYMGFEVGGHYAVWDVDGDDNDQEAFGAGAKYENGPYGVAFNYRHGWNDATDQEQDAFMLSSNYILGPGINVGAALLYADEERPGAANDRETIAGIVGIGLGF